MAFVRRIPDGRYAINGLSGGPFVVLSVGQIQELIDALIDAGMLESGGNTITRAPRR